MPAPVYPYDPSGTASTNRIQNEVHPITTALDRTFVPSGGPFYTTGLQIINSVTGDILQPHIDYKALELYRNATLATSGEVCCVIRILNTALTSVTLTTYQVPGGQFSSVAQTLLDLLATNPNLPQSVMWGDIIDAPDQFNPTMHLHNGADIMNMNAFITAIYQIQQQIAAGDNASFNAVYQWAKQYVDYRIQGSGSVDISTETTRALNAEQGIRDSLALYAPLANPGFTGQVKLPDGTAAAPSLTFASDVGLNTGIYWIAQGQFGITSQGTNVLSVSPGLVTIPTLASGTLIKAPSTVTGGSILLDIASTSSIASNLIVDSFGNSFRVYEGGGSHRGFYIDITTLANGAGTRLATGADVTTLQNAINTLLTRMSTAEGSITTLTNANFQGQITAVNGRVDTLQTQVNGLATAGQLPLGSYHASTNSSNPGFSYGTWVIALQGLVPVGWAPGSGSWTGTVGQQYGDYNIALDVSQIPGHQHYCAANNGGYGDGVPSPNSPANSTNPLGNWRESGYGNANLGAASYAQAPTGLSFSTGGGAAHSNVQPSQVVVWWLRTA